MGVVCNDRCLCSDIIIIYLPELFAFSASRFRQTIQAGILYYSSKSIGLTQNGWVTEELEELKVSVPV